MTGLPGLPSPSYQRLSTSIRHSPSIPVTTARQTTYRIQYLFIEEPSPELKDVSFVQPYRETTRRRGVSAIIHSMRWVKTTKLMDLRVFGPVVEDILARISHTPSEF